MKKGETLELTVTGIGPAGEGVAHYQDWMIRIPYALPGQTVQARIIKRRQKQAQARLVSLVEARADQIQPACAHFGQPPSESGTGCGGCLWQQANYSLQRQWKLEILQTLLNPLLEQPLSWPEVLPSPLIWGYRNKFELSFGDRTYLSDAHYQSLRQNGQPLPRTNCLGFHIPGSFGTLVDIQSCQLMSRPLQQLYQRVKALLPTLGGDVYNLRQHTGYWRHLILRQGFRTGELMLHLNTTSQHQPHWPTLIEALSDFSCEGAYLRSILHSEHDGNAQIVGHQPVTVLAGDAMIEERLCGLNFEISPYAFFQTNTEAAEVLYTQIKAMAHTLKVQTIYDLYSGTGTIGMILAAQAERVFGIEEISSAVADAERNARRNGLNNCQFLTGKVEQLLPQLITSHPPDLVILDPPRAGLHPKALQMMLALQAPHLILVSCNPAALARDLSELQSRYRVQAIQPVDMFPHTGHIETLVQLSLRDI